MLTMIGMKQKQQDIMTKIKNWLHELSEKRNVWEILHDTAGERSKPNRHFWTIFFVHHNQLALIQEASTDKKKNGKSLLRWLYANTKSLESDLLSYMSRLCRSPHRAKKELFPLMFLQVTRFFFDFLRNLVSATAKDEDFYQGMLMLLLGLKNLEVPD